MDQLEHFIQELQPEGFYTRAELFDAYKRFLVKHQYRGVTARALYRELRSITLRDMLITELKRSGVRGFVFETIKQ